MRNIKAKALALGLMTSLAMGLAVMPGATAFAETAQGTAAGQVGDGVTVKGYQDKVYKVTVSWGEMTFRYRTVGEAKKWVPVSGENDDNTDLLNVCVNQMIVTNESDFPITGQFGFQANGIVEDLTGYFFNARSVTLENGQIGTLTDKSNTIKNNIAVYLGLNGEPDSSLGYTYSGAQQIGTVTLTISSDI